MPLIKTKQPILFTQAAAVTVANTTNETTVVSSTAEGTLTIQKNSTSVGKTFRVKARGYYSNTGTPTLTVKLKAGSTVLLTSGAITTTTAASNRAFEFEGEVTVYSLGSSGTVRGQGSVSEFGSAVTGIASTAAVTVDTTANQTLNITVQWGTASASNTITITNVVVEELN